MALAAEAHRAKGHFRRSKSTLNYLNSLKFLAKSKFLDTLIIIIIIIIIVVVIVIVIVI